ncbi:MAG: ribosome biogenesis GTPase Der [Polyangiaceae bacterium]|nr:ribosome biogenesis GTPase Der [Myxococcales bacterium]MCC6898918.1 ribosome biogenesis GTPase Der [Polyangiaceae bacterium]
MRPVVAIVGRPNVGKSTLFNRLAGKRLAIVDDAPGVTRDRNYGDVHLGGRELVLIDTGGFDPTDEDPMRQGIARQVRAALAEADVVICVLDGSMSPTLADREAVKLLRRSEKPVLFVANKSDDRHKAMVANELYEMGVPSLIPVSALHGRGTAELIAALGAVLPPGDPEGEPSADGGAIRVAIVGRPNAGKSSLVNRLAKSERSLVDDRPGTTRDPVDTRIEIDGQAFIVVDTAGIRRRAKVERGVEAASVIRAIRSMERAQVVVLLCEATEGIAEQDARLMGLVAERGRAVVIGLNKTDLLDKAGRKRAEEQVRDSLRFAPWAPLVQVSAKNGWGVQDLMRTVRKAAEEFDRRVTTGELNRFFATVLEHRTPPTHKGRAPRIYFITQARSSPPVFVAVSNAPEHIKESYKRYVINQIRKTFGFECVPIELVFRGRGKREE